MARSRSCMVTTKALAATQSTVAAQPATKAKRSRRREEHVEAGEQSQERDTAMTANTPGFGCTSNGEWS